MQGNSLLFYVITYKNSCQQFYVILPKLWMLSDIIVTSQKSLCGQDSLGLGLWRRENFQILVRHNLPIRNCGEDLDILRRWNRLHFENHAFAFCSMTAATKLFLVWKTWKSICAHTPGNGLTLANIKDVLRHSAILQTERNIRGLIRIR